MNVFRAEIRRILARRAVVVLLIAGFGLSLLVVGAELWDHRPVSAAALQEAQARADAEAQRPSVQRMYEDCQEQPRRFGGNCNTVLPQAEWFLNVNPLRVIESVNSISTPLVAVLGFLALLAGTSFVGAEYASGSMSNVLLFEPRRWRVWLAKMTATGVVVGMAAAATVAVCYGTLIVVGLSWTDVSVTSEQWWALAYRALRVVLVVAAAGLIGAAVTAALRSTIATVGLVLGYLVVGEALLRAVLFPQTVRILASNRVAAFVDGRLRIEHYTDTMKPEVYRLFLQESAGYLAVAMAVILLLSYAVFRRRDLT